MGRGIAGGNAGVHGGESSRVGGMDAPTPQPHAGSIDPSVSGPLSREQAAALLARADAFMAGGYFAEAVPYYQRVIGHPSADVTAAALLGLGEALYRLDEDDAALSAWRSVLELPETPATYQAWRRVAAALVRSDDLRGARDAYRQAERRAPAEDRAEIASRLGWLNKELGDTRASRRYFARARGDTGLISATTAIILVTVGISVATLYSTLGQEYLMPALALDKTAVANGEYWRLLTVTLVHASLLHLAFNMYALAILGPLVERAYGKWTFLALYLVTGFMGNVAAFVFGSPQVLGAGASTAVFGLFGVWLAYNFRRRDNPFNNANLRGLLVILALNFVINVFASSFLDWRAHLGGFLTGIALGYAAEGVGRGGVKRASAVLSFAVVLGIGAVLVFARIQQLQTLFGVA
jgi:rhomboid protease GluP